LDESEREVGVAASPLLPIAGNGGTVQCAFRPLPLRPGIYFPVVAILSADGRIQDRWKLDRAVVVEANGKVDLPEEFGPVKIISEWTPA
jgi:hypothetical protein